jgi:capsular polysaccharide biosynthesis protein
MEQQNNTFENKNNSYGFWVVAMKRKKIVIGSFLFFVVVATITSFLMPKIYQGDAVLKVHQASSLTVNELIDVMGSMNGEKLQSVLPTTYDSITTIKFKSYKDSKDSNKIAATIEARDADAIQPALSELIEYMNNIAIVKAGIKDEQEMLLNRSQELDVIIAASTGILNDYHQLLKQGKLVPLGFNPADLYRKLSDIKVEKFQLVQMMRKANHGVEIARQLYVGHHHVKPSKKEYMMIGGMAGLFVGLVLAFLMESNEKMVKKNKA